VRENYTLAMGVKRKKDQRWYRGQTYLIEKNSLRSPCIFKTEQAIYNLTRIQQKMLWFWFYDGQIALTNEKARSRHSSEVTMESFWDWNTQAIHYKPLKL